MLRWKMHRLRKLACVRTYRTIPTTGFPFLRSVFFPFGFLDSACFVINEGIQHLLYSILKMLMSFPRAFLVLSAIGQVQKLGEYRSFTALGLLLPGAL